jgi:hypothetical protein
MRGTEWIVPVVVLIVYLISTIMKSRENDEPVRPKRAAGGDNGGRKPTGDIDRFLQEIDRLRRKSAAEQAPVVKPVPRVRPATPTVSRPRPAQRVRAAAPVVEAVAIEPPPVVTPAVPVTQSEFIAPAPVAKQARVAQVTGTEVRQSPGVTAALHLLRSPRTLAAAVVLHEVLGPPKSKR